MAPQSGKAVPQNVEALPNLATTVTVDGTTKQEQIYKQIIHLPFSDIIQAPYVNRILPHMVIWNAIPEIH